jgi:hypothetical protein
MSGPEATIADIIAELKNLQGTPAADLSKGEALPFPRSLPAGEGRMIVISKKIDQLVGHVSRSLFNEDAKLKSQYSKSEWGSEVRRALGASLVTIDLDHDSAASAKATLVSVRAMLTQRLASIDPRDFVFGCTLFGNEVAPFAIGPVTFEARQKWLERYEASGSIDAVMARRIGRVWRGHKLAKRKKNLDNLREADLFDVIGTCPYVCTVAAAGLAPEAAKEKALTAARLALTSIALLWQTPSKTLNGMNLLYDQGVTGKKTLAFIPGKISLAGWQLAYLPYGGTFKPNEWEAMFQKYAAHFKTAGEVIFFLLSPTGQSNRPKIANALAQALLWFHQGCRENVSLMASVNFAAAMDALASGGKSGGIKRLIKARLGINEADPIRADSMTLKQAVDEIYSDARSRTIHGTNDKLGHDWSETKGIAEQLAAICIRACIAWAASDNGPDRPTRMSE